jgi:hypothetical protein
VTNSAEQQIDTQLEILELWADLYRKQAFQEGLSSKDWQAATELSETAKAAEDLSRRDLKNLLDRSSGSFHPLADPLTLDFGLHRWLSSEREEAYSDWFAWVLEQMGNFGQIFKLFTVGDKSFPLECASQKPIICRELSILNRSRRPDLVIYCGDRPLLVVEIKTRSFDEELVRKQLTEYALWANGHQEPPRCFFVAVELGEFSCPMEFEPLPWRELSLRVREQVRAWVRAAQERQLDGGHFVRAAMALAFCGAVERNLLELSGEPKTFEAYTSKGYLQEWLARTEGENDGQI